MSLCKRVHDVLQETLSLCAAWNRVDSSTAALNWLLRAPSWCISQAALLCYCQCL